MVEQALWLSVNNGLQTIVKDNNPLSSLGPLFSTESKFNTCWGLQRQ